ncbi:uncharacterized protein LOC124445389 isoform X2 [Xenia sp. Carnegie-2017]|nr:uncharacterized protein LOC124445389 isoform X2 [Xenia sp. Carnegie-2017]
MMCCEFTNPSSFVLVLDTKTGGGERQVKIPKNHKNCHPLEIFSLKKDEWKSFSSSDQVFSMEGKKLKWNFNKTSSLTTWSNKILRVNFQCTTTPNNSKNVCIIVKIKPEIPVATTRGPFMKSSSPKVATIVNSKNTVLMPRTKPKAKTNATYTTIQASTKSSSTATLFSVTVTSTPETETGNKTDKTPRRLSTSHLPVTNGKETSEGTQIQKPSGDRKMQKKESSNALPIVGGSVAALLTLICSILGIICFRRRSSFKKHPSIVEINGKQAGEKDNVSVANLHKNPTFDDDNGVYQEPDLIVNSASSACKLYEPADKHEYDYAKVEQRYEQPEQFEYDYVDSSGIAKPFKNGVHFSKSENTLPNVEKVNETKEDGEVVYNTIEPDDLEPVYHTLE